jgi:hypothetical protein
MRSSAPKVLEIMMNKASEMKSAAARLEAEKEMDLRKKAEAARRAEKEEERQLETVKMARLRALRLAREAALREAVTNTRSVVMKKKAVGKR